MDKRLSVVNHQRKTKPAVKVVHISNPIKVKTSASEFRALVQKLTGRDSDLSVSTGLSNFSDTCDTQGFQTVPKHHYHQLEQKTRVIVKNDDDEHQEVLDNGYSQNVVDGVEQYPCNNMKLNSSDINDYSSTFGVPFEEDFCVPQNLSYGILFNPPTFLYESPHGHQQGGGQIFRPELLELR